MSNQFSPSVSEVLVYSKEEACRLRNSYIGPEHMLLGLLRSGEGNAIDLLGRLFINIDGLKKEVERRITEKNETSSSILYEEDVTLNQKASKILRLCVLEARLLKSEVADTEHLLLAILKENDNIAADVLHDNFIDYKKVFNLLSVKPDIKSGLGFQEDDDEEEDDFENIQPSSSSQGKGQGQSIVPATRQRRSSGDTPVIDNFSTDLTQAAADGKLDPVVGREREIERLAQILCRRKKNNPLLIGEPGVGKSAIVEGLALRIVQRKVSRMLFDKRVVSLDLAGVVAGTKYRGQFEERVRSIITELQKNPNIILFIDEIHTIVGAGSAPGSMDAANMLKPALSRGEVQCIGATTLDEYRKSIEKDGALDRRFQKVLVEPTTADETYQILLNIKDRYEEHHNVTYTDAALHACVKLSDRYITDRNFPDKAIDVLDETGSRVHLTNISVPKEFEEQEKVIESARQKKNDAVRNQNYELAARFRDQEKNYEYQYETMRREWEESLKDKRQVVDEEQIAEVVSMMSGIPVQRVATDEGIRLKGMKDELMGHVIAQDAAIEKLVKAIRRSRIGLKNPDKPIGTFMFLGPTGVGKTLLAKELSKFMFGTADALIRIDMSEYMEKFTVSRLVGAPPGYVGYEEGGQLTERVRRRPYSIVLLDEIEKAHPDVFNLLLQVMDEGRLTDSYGRLVDFRNTVLIMTSNIGTRQLKEFGVGVGFTASQNAGDKEYSRSVIQKALNKSFAPEFINRVDEIITFDQLDKEAILRIVDLELGELLHRTTDMGYVMEVDDAAKQFLADKGYDVQYGARPLKRAIQSYVEDELAELMIENDLATGDTVHVTADKENDKLGFSVTKNRAVTQK